MDDFRQMASDDAVALARAAAEAIRGLNHATRCDAGLGQPSAAYDVIGALSLAASRLGQLLTQITGYLDRSLQSGRLGHDLGEAQQQLALINGNPAPRDPQDQP